MDIRDVDLKELETKLAKKADGWWRFTQPSVAKFADNFIGMFLWARLVLEYLTTNMFVTTDRFWLNSYPISTTGPSLGCNP